MKTAIRVSTSETYLVATVVQTARVLQQHCNCCVCLKKKLLFSWLPFFTPQERGAGLNALAGFHKCHST